MPLDFRTGIAAGVYKKAKNVPTDFGFVSHITFGSFCWTKNEGNAQLACTELFDEATLSSKNAKGLPNDGIVDFVENELPLIVAMFEGTGVKIRVSLSPRGQNELLNMVGYLIKTRAYEVIDELEINLSCPNHRGAHGLSPVLAHDPDAVREALKEVSGYPGMWGIKLAPEMEDVTLRAVVELAAYYKVGSIISGNTKPESGPLHGKMLSTPDGKGGIGGAPLLTPGLKQMSLLRSIIAPYGHKPYLYGVGGIVSSDALKQYYDHGADDTQMATIPYFQGPKAVYNILTGAHLG